jgi:hypothetical protein
MGGLPLPYVERGMRGDEVRKIVAFVCFYVSAMMCVVWSEEIDEKGLDRCTLQYFCQLACGEGRLCVLLAFSAMRDVVLEVCRLLLL